MKKRKGSGRCGSGSIVDGVGGKEGGGGGRSDIVSKKKKNLLLFTPPPAAAPPLLVLILIFLLILCTNLNVVNGEFGDYVDPTFNCPAQTTCPIACVADVADCPPELNCSVEGGNGNGGTLCADGSCAPPGEECDEELETPCPADCAPVVCAKVVDNFDDCNTKYESIYTAANECEVEEEESIEEVSWTNPAFIFCYVWISISTVAVLVWCAFNQRIKPLLEDSTKLLDEAAIIENIGGAGGAANDGGKKNKTKVENGTAQEEEEEEQEQQHKHPWTQTAYKTTLLGILIHIMTLITLWGFQIILLILCIFYYMQQEAITRWDPVFLDEVQVLLVFEIVWMIGFVWSLSMKWPSSVQCLFLRRCVLNQATHIAVFAPYLNKFGSSSSSWSSVSTTGGGGNKEGGVGGKKVGHISCIQKVIKVLRRMINGFFRFLFSDVNHPSSSIPGKMTYCKVQSDVNTGQRYFNFRHRRYNYSVEEGKFVPGVWTVGSTIGDLLNDETKNGLDNDGVNERISTVGQNTIAMSKPTFLKCILQEFNKPFYVYQNYLVWTWVPLWYYHMALVETFVRVIGGLVVAFFKYRNEMSFYELSKIQGTVEVLRNGKYEVISQKDLVPGDVVVLNPGLTYCDMVILSSEHVLVDESALTGESSPVAKMELDASESQNLYEPHGTHKKNTIMAGTTILETSETERYLALVTKCGSFTSKGELLREVLSYKRHKFKFDVEVQMVIVILFFYAIFGFAITVYLLADHPVYAWFYGMFVVATCLPPLLPTVFVVSVGISDNRLQKKRIACTNNEGILVAGKVKVAFFDKTGTLTKPGLDLLSTKSVDNWNDDTIGKSGATVANGLLGTGMAVCHNLTTISSSSSSSSSSCNDKNELVGHSVDTKMFESTNAILNFVDGQPITITESPTSSSVSTNNKWIVLKRFDFDHGRMTQSVIVQNSSSLQVKIFVKGSPESIQKLCIQSSLPNNFDETIRNNARRGYYQICMGYRDASSLLNAFDSTNQNWEHIISNIKRDDVESQLDFIGLINFKNMLKDETHDILQQLAEGDVKSFMITGDSVLTGIYIAKECGLIDPDCQVILGKDVDELSGDVVWVDESSDARVALPTLQSLQSSQNDVELAITGHVWAYITTHWDSETVSQLAKSIRVYGRCTPNDKVSVVTCFVKHGYITLMCGDGGNDCGALKTAHVGVALSDAEASTVSPFTSLDKSLYSVVTVLKEGRCALASAFSSYKYMIMYGQVETANQIATAYFSITFSEWSWVFLDGVWVLTMAFTLPLAKAAKTLSSKRPTSSLLGPHTMTSFLGPFFINLLFMIIALLALFAQDWYQCRKWGSTDISNILVISDNYEAGVIFIVTGYQYVSSAMMYNFGFTHRAPWIKNYIFVLCALGFTVIHFYATLVPGTLSCFFRLNCTNENVVRGTDLEYYAIHNPFNTTVIPTSFRWILVALMIINTIIIMSFEYFFVNGCLQTLISNYKRRKYERMKLEQLSNVASGGAGANGSGGAAGGGVEKAQDAAAAKVGEKGSTMNDDNNMEGGLAVSRNFSGGFNVVHDSVIQVDGLDPKMVPG